MDAAFAFAVTLLVISGNQLPRSVDDLIAALKNVPTFAASFLLLVMFWNAHADWSRRFGLDDAITRRWSLAMVFLVLIFVYPLRMVFSSLFAVASRGWLPTNFAPHAWTDVPAMFITYDLAYGGLCVVMWRLFNHALARQDVLGLSRVERIEARVSRLRWQWLTAVAAVSVLLAAGMIFSDFAHLGWLLGMPGYIFALNWFLRPLSRRLRARLANAAEGT